MTAKRCAIYTRKSTEDGLEQEFNSLDAQREASEAFIVSQKHEGWLALSARYDDGGFSGGNVERPALQRLLADIDARKIDVIVVYKVDRLSRSLADFVRLIERIEAAGVSFVSVTQQFNTASSMGRLTLNVLLSFAQFEREVTAERIRDKIAASRKRGLWTGGPIPLGYDVIDKKLIVNEAEAMTVRNVFRTYLEVGCVRELMREADRRGYITKRRTFKNANGSGGICFTRGSLYHLLRNPIYVGRIRHKGAAFPGQHAAIIDQKLWDEVQGELDRKRRRYTNSEHAQHPSLLTGKVEDDQGRRLTPSHATKNGRRYRYYISRPDHAVDAGWRIPAAVLETAATDVVDKNLSDQAGLSRSIGGAFINTASITSTLRNGAPSDKRALLDRLLKRVVISESELMVEVSLAALLEELGALRDESCSDAVLTWKTPVRIAKRGIEMKLILPGRTHSASPDDALIRAVASGRGWFEELARGDAPSLKTIAEREGIDPGNLTRHVGLAFLAPDIVEAILEGCQPAHLTTERLTRVFDLPLEWAEQRRVLGFEEASLQHQS